MDHVGGLPDRVLVPHGIVVARQEEDRYRDGGHRLEGPTDRPGPDSVRLEYVAGYDHERGPLGSRHPADRGQAIDPSLGIPRLRVSVEKAPSHPELEISSVDEANRWDLPILARGARSRDADRC